MNLGTVFHRHMLREPGAVAIVDGETRRTFGDWYGEILAVAGGLQMRGVKAGDHFVTVLSNRYETATLYWACQMLGAIFTPFNWRANGEEVAYVLSDAEADAITQQAAAEMDDAIVWAEGQPDPAVRESLQWLLEHPNGL